MDLRDNAEQSCGTGTGALDVASITLAAAAIGTTPLVVKSSRQRRRQGGYQHALFFAPNDECPRATYPQRTTSRQPS